MLKLKRRALIKIIMILVMLFLSGLSISNDATATYIVSGENSITDEDISIAQTAIDELKWNTSGTNKIELSLPKFEGYSWTVRKDIGEYVAIGLNWEQVYDGVGGQTLEMDLTNPNGVGFYIIFSNTNTLTVIAEETYIYYPDSGVEYIVPQDRVSVSIDIDTLKINQFYDVDQKKINVDDSRVTGLLELNPTIDIDTLKDSGVDSTSNSGSSSKSSTSTETIGSQNNNINFLDLQSSHWAYKEIYSLAGLGYIKGYPNGNFSPDGNITRAEFSVMLSVIVQDKWLQGSLHNSINFTDLKATHWSYDGVNRLMTYMTKDELIKIFGNKFQPDKYISREEVAAIIFAVLKNNDKFSAVDNSKPDFIDLNKSKFIDSLIFCGNQGFITGYPDKTFKPENKISRAEIAAILAKVIDKF